MLRHILARKPPPCLASESKICFICSSSFFMDTQRNIFVGARKTFGVELIINKLFLISFPFRGSDLRLASKPNCLTHFRFWRWLSTIWNVNGPSKGNLEKCHVKPQKMSHKDFWLHPSVTSRIFPSSLKWIYELFGRMKNELIKQFSSGIFFCFATEKKTNENWNSKTCLGARSRRGGWKSGNVVSDYWFND